MLDWVVASSMMLACSAPMHPLIIAHRGGMDSRYPENTLPAFHHAAAAGAHVVELDLRATRDGHVVVMHDRRVDRTTDGQGAVEDLSLSEVRRLDAGDGIRVPTLDEVLSQNARHEVELLFDIKPAPGLRHPSLVAAAARAGQLPRILFGVRSLEDRARLAEAEPGLRFLAFAPRPERIADFLGAGVEVVRLWPRWIARDPELVARVQQAGARVWVTAGDASVDELRALAALGVDGLLTDRPAAAAAAFGCG